MSATAAAQLLELISGWNQRGDQSVYKARASEGQPTFEGVAVTSLRACALLDTIADDLRGRGLYDVNRSMLTSIAKTVFSPDANWAAVNSNSKLSDSQRGSLATWDALTRHAPSSQFRLDDADVEAVDEALEEALDVLGTVPGIPEEHRQYIGDLLRGCRQLIDGDDPDLVGARSRFHEALGAVILQPGVRGSEEGGELLKKLSRIGVHWFFGSVGVPVATGIAANVGSTFLLEALVW